MPVRDLTLAERQLRDLSALVNSTGGTTDGTVADVSTVVTGVDGTGSNAASKADVDARLVAINNNLAELTVRMNMLLSRLKVE